MRGQPAPISAALVSLNGELAGQRFALNLDQFVGLNCTDAEIAFHDTRLGVSRLHMRITFVDGQFVMADYASTNGVFWNDQPVTSHVLAHGDHIRAGDAEFRFELG